MMDERSHQIPDAVRRAALHTLYRAMVYCRNIAGNPGARMAVVYDLMDALHEIPNILDGWGTYDNDVAKLRLYFGCFKHEKWRDDDSLLRAPDLTRVFDEKLTELEKA